MGSNTLTLSSAEFAGSAPTKKKQRKRVRKVRSFDAAQYDRTIAEWIQSSIALFDEELRQDLDALRARSRDSSINDVYARRYLKALRNQVVGSNGVGMRVRAKNRDGSLDKYANDVIKDAYEMWGKEITVDGLNMIQAQQMFLETTARDGECLVQLLRGKEYGPYGLKLRFIESDYLDHQMNEKLSNGNIVRNGIEYNLTGEIIAYHIWKYHPKDLYTYNIRKNERVRVLKKDLIHGYDRERSSQGRGYPWLASGLLMLTHIKEYAKSELVASRVASGKMGFFTRPAGEDDLLGDEITDDDVVIQEVEPGTFDILPEGYDLRTFDPQNPNGNFKEFVKVILRGVASGVGVSYNTLSGDFESGSYSSARQSVIEERETWKNHQMWLIQSFLEPVFKAWLEMAILSGAGKLQSFNPNMDKYNRVEWMPRTWQWIDPAKEKEAIKTQLDYKLRSRTEVCRSLGRDFTDVVQEIASEDELMQELGLLNTPADPVEEDNNNQDNEQNEQQE